MGSSLKILPVFSIDKMLENVVVLSMSASKVMNKEYFLCILVKVTQHANTCAGNFSCTYFAAQYQSQ